MSNFWENLLLYLAGASVSIISILIQQRHERKRFALERKDKYKLIAVEKRLEAHQKAFVHSVALFHCVFEPNDKKSKVIDSAYEFWLNNCLYLEKVTRYEFKFCIGLVDGYQLRLKMKNNLAQSPERKKLEEEIQKEWERIVKLPVIIQEEVDLEPIKIEPEYTALGEKIKGKKDNKNE